MSEGRNRECSPPEDWSTFKARASGPRGLLMALLPVLIAPPPPTSWGVANDAGGPGDSKSQASPSRRGDKDRAESVCAELT